MNAKLTERQQQVLNLIKENLISSGMPPTRNEIANALGFKSANAAEQHLKALAKKGAIEMLPGASRGIRIIDDEIPPEEPITGIPIVGRVAAGSPILATEHIDHYIPVSPDLFNPPADYFLKVQGMSMRDAGILDDDLLAVHQIKQAHNGDIVVARIEDEVTVKRFYRQGHEVKLVAENPDFSPVIIDLRSQPVEIEGIAVGIVRNHGAL